MVKYYSTKTQIKNACVLCLQYKIYQTSGVMQDWYRDDVKFIKCMSIYFIHNVPVGAFVVLNYTSYRGYNCGTYVKMDYRRKGIGRALVETMKKHKIVMKPWIGSPDAFQFYKNLNLC